MARRHRLHPAWYLAALVLLGAAGATTVFLAGSAQRRSDRRGLVRYEREILPAAKRAGEIVQTEMKPSLRELHTGAVDGERFVERTQAWERVFLASRAELLAADPPAILGDVERTWARSFDTYIEAIRLFRRAAKAGGAERERLLDEGVTRAEEADTIYDEASRRLQRARRAVGLRPTGNFPDPDSEDGE